MGEGELVHTHGTNHFDLRNAMTLRGTIELPPGLSGELVVANQVKAIGPA